MALQPMSELLVDLALPVGPAAPGSARQAVRAATAALPDELRGDLALVASELVTNGVRHAGLGAGEVVRLRLAVDDRCLRLEVADAGPGFAPARHPAAPPPGTEGGRGLMIVDRLADRWGVSSRPTVVWCELGLAAAA